MSIDHKLRLMEAIWTEICRTPDEYASPDRHRDELEETEKKRASGDETLIDWEEAKTKLRDHRDDV